MSKRNKIMLGVGACVLLVLALLYAFVFSKMQPDSNKSDQDDETEAVYVFENAEQENILQLDVEKNGTPQYTIYYDSSTDELLLSGLEVNLYNDSFDSIVSCLSTLTVESVLDDALDASEYSVDDENSKYTVKLSTKDGGEQILYVGDETVSGNGFYARKNASDEIFIISGGISKLFKEKNSLLSTVLATPLDNSKYYRVESFTLYKELLPFVEIEFVPEEERKDGDIYGGYRMTYPAAYTPADVNYDTVLRCLITPSADSVVTTEITAENLELYGFTVPSFELKYTLDGDERVIYFGKRTGDGLIYVLSPQFSFIGLVGVESSFEFLDWDLVKYVNPALFGLNIDRVAKITVSTNDGDKIYRLDGLGSELVVTDEDLGTTVDTYNFRQFYRVLLMASMDGYADTQSTDDRMLGFIVETRDGETQAFDFYRQSTRKCFYTVDGKGEFYVDIDVVEKILSDADKLKRGESINADSQL